MSAEEVQKLRDAFDRGLGLRKTARDTGLNRETVGRYYREWRNGAAQHPAPHAAPAPAPEPPAHHEGKPYILKRVKISTGQEWVEDTFDNLRRAIGRAWTSGDWGSDVKSLLVDGDGKFIMSVVPRTRREAREELR